MRTAIFDIETSGLYANFGSVLCAVVKKYEARQIKTFRLDKYPSWKKGIRSECAGIIHDLVKELEQYDVLVAHNGQYFDKQWINTLCLKYNLDPTIRWKKFIDPVLLSRRHLRLSNNSLAALLDYFEIPEQKTQVKHKYWIKATLDGDRKAMDYITHHCVKDVVALEAVYDKCRKLIENIDNRGSAR